MFYFVPFPPMVGANHKLRSMLFILYLHTKFLQIYIFFYFIVGFLYISYLLLPPVIVSANHSEDDKN
jgi:hypothetical protein